MVQLCTKPQHKRFVRTIKPSQHWNQNKANFALRTLSFSFQSYQLTISDMRDKTLWEKRKNCGNRSINKLLRFLVINRSWEYFFLFWDVNLHLKVSSSLRRAKAFIKSRSMQSKYYDPSHQLICTRFIKAKSLLSIMSFSKFSNIQQMVFRDLNRFLKRADRMRALNNASARKKREEAMQQQCEPRTQRPVFIDRYEFNA